jgi:parvulin-like peptidyl-prolyl isomerase
LLLAACSHHSTPQTADAAPPGLSDTEVARVGEVVISRETFEHEWNRRAEVRNKEKLLQEMIRFEALLARARAAGVDRHPEVVAAFNRLVVGKFQEEEWQRRGLDSIQASEAEIQAYYQAHLDRFATPAQVRLGIILRKASVKATTETRELLRHEAEALWNQARHSSEDGFRQLAMSYSEDQATRYAGGDTGWFVPEQAGSRWEPAVLRAAASLSAPGDLAPLVEGGDGFHIVKLLGRQPASRRPLAEVRDGVEYQLRMEKAQGVRQHFFAEMQAGLSIEINRAALEAIPERTIRTASGRPPSLPK